VSIVATVFGYDRLRSPRGIATALLTMVYLFVGALHGACELDVTNPSGRGAIALSAPVDADGSGNAMAAEHHCHGCFSVSIPTPVQALSVIEPKVARLSEPPSDGSDLIPGIDTPPPKTLT
jgi:hypothetical protein